MKLLTILLATIVTSVLSGCIGNPVTPYTMGFKAVSLVPSKVNAHTGKIHIYPVISTLDLTEGAYVGYEMGAGFRQFNRPLNDPRVRPEGRLPVGFYATLTEALKQSLEKAGYTVTTGDTPPADAETSVRTTVTELWAKRGSKCKAWGSVFFIMEDLRDHRRTLLRQPAARTFTAYASNTVYQDALAGVWRNAESKFLAQLYQFRTGQVDPDIPIQIHSMMVSPNDD